jgi:CRISPR-associated protein Cmr4
MSDITDINTSARSTRRVQSRILLIFTRTPLHVGAGSSVGAIDQPIQRERHTGFPIIPASSLKGTFADAWAGDFFQNGDGERSRVKRGSDGDNAPPEIKDSAWLFGSDDANLAWAGAIQFGEARLLAFPIRSARGSFGWDTSPLLLRRAVREGVLPAGLLPQVPSGQADEAARFAKGGPLAIEDKVVLEEYTFTHFGEVPAEVGERFKLLLEDDPVWSEAGARLVILSDGMMSFFAQNACEVAQHVRIDDRTGTAAGGALFNQENVPSETLFYSTVYCSDERTARKADHERRTAGRAAEALQSKIEAAGGVFQFGGDASTGLGYCTVRLIAPEKEGVQ